MSDLINRQAAIDAVKKNTFRLTFAEEQNCEGHVAWSANAVYSDVIEGALLELPSAQPKSYREGYQAGLKDAQPEWKRGKWIRQDNKGKPLYGWYQCSECGAVIGGKANFCSECGADMRQVGG